MHIYTLYKKHTLFFISAILFFQGPQRGIFAHIFFLFEVLKSGHGSLGISRYFERT